MLMKNNFHFHDIRRVEQAIRDLAIRTNHPLTEEELKSLCSKVPLDIAWEPSYRS